MRKRKVLPVITKIVPGTEHYEEGTECQDYIEADEVNPDVTVMVGCDGARYAEKAAEGAKGMADAWVKYLEENEDVLWKTDSEQSKMQLAKHTRKTLEQLASVENCQIEELGSTIMAVIVNAKKDRWMAFHLGDGAIMSKDTGEDTYSFLTVPMNVMGSMTYLTTSRNVEKRLVVKKGSLDNIQSFAIVTDGVYGDNVNRLTIDDKIDRLIYGGGIEPALGDQGIAVMRLSQ